MSPSLADTCASLCFFFDRAKSECAWSGFEGEEVITRCGSRSTQFQGGRELLGALCSRSFALCNGGSSASRRRRCNALLEGHPDCVASVSFHCDEIYCQSIFWSELRSSCSCRNYYNIEQRVSMYQYELHFTAASFLSCISSNPREAKIYLGGGRVSLGGMWLIADEFVIRDLRSTEHSILYS